MEFPSDSILRSLRYLTNFLLDLLMPIIMDLLVDFSFSLWSQHVFLSELRMISPMSSLWNVVRTPKRSFSCKKLWLL